MRIEIDKATTSTFWKLNIDCFLLVDTSFSEGTDPVWILQVKDSEMKIYRVFINSSSSVFMRSVFSLGSLLIWNSL